MAAATLGDELPALLDLSLLLCFFFFPVGVSPGLSVRLAAAAAWSFTLLFADFGGFFIAAAVFSISAMIGNGSVPFKSNLHS